MIKILSIGQYSYKASIIHKLDPRLKLIYVLLLSSLIFFIDKTHQILIFSLSIIIIILLSKLKIKKLFASLRPFYVIFIFLFFMYLIFSRNRLQNGLITIWRFLMLLVISFLLTYTTTLSNLITAIEKLIKPLKIIKVKPRSIAVMISITVRFVPVMFDNLERLKESMLSRAANFRKLKHIKLLILKLLENLFKSASNLSDAMQARLYNENIESRKIFYLVTNDYLSILFILIFIVSTLTL